MAVCCAELCRDRLSSFQDEEEEEEPVLGLGRRPGGGGGSDNAELYEAAVSHANREASEECCRKALAAIRERDFLATVGARPPSPCMQFFPRGELDNSLFGPCD
jgi:hypothetical protein